MTVENLLAEARRLSHAEQVELFDGLVQMVDPQTAPFTLTPAQSADLNRRIDEYRAGKAVMLPGEDTIAKIRARLACERTS